MNRLICGLMLVLMSATASEARPRKPVVAHEDCNITMPCEGVSLSPRGQEIARAMHFGRAQNIYSGTIVAHPAGCPRRSFCGCGASVHLFGKPIRDLFLARNWFKFPKTSPAPRTAAVRRGHVFVLLEHREGSKWLVYDANSGGRQTRIHIRSIAGYTIVAPNT